MSVDPLTARLWFESVDFDSSGLLDAKELRQALDIGGLNYSLAQAHLFVRAFDARGNQKLDVNEFMELHRFLDAVQSCFARFSRGNRQLSAAEVQQSLTHMGYSLESTAMQSVLLRYDKDVKGSFGLETFLHMCLFLRTAERAFRGFDTASSGAVQLNFNQFCYSAAHLA